MFLLYFNLSIVTFKSDFSGIHSACRYVDAAVQAAASGCLRFLASAASKRRHYALELTSQPSLPMGAISGNLWNSGRYGRNHHRVSY
jgi:hypothetical protein